MDKPANALYEQWQLTLPSIPAPSVLYALVPIGIGTPLVESMTSYIARLAEAHCVFPGVLMRHVIVPFVERHSTGEGRSTTLHLRDGKATGALNANQQTAMNAVNALESLTKLRGLRVLTMVTWAEVLPLLARFARHEHGVRAVWKNGALQVISSTNHCCGQYKQ